MKKKLLVLIPALSLLASCGATQAVVHEAELQSFDFEEYNILDEEYVDIFRSAFRNIFNATSVIYSGMESVTDKGAYYMGGIMGSTTAGYLLSTNRAVFYEDELACSVERYYDVYSDGMYARLSEEKYYYQTEKAPESASYTARAFYMSSNSYLGSTPSLNAEFNDISGYTYEEYAEEAGDMMRANICSEVANAVEFISDVRFYNYKVDGNLLTFEANERGRDSIENPDYSSDPRAINYIPILESYSMKVTYERNESDYRIVNYQVYGTVYACSDSFGNYLFDNKELLAEFNVSCMISYDKQTGYQQQNIFHYLPASSSVNFAPCITIFTDFPTTNSDSDIAFDDFHSAMPKDITYEMQQYFDVPDNVMYFGAEDVYLYKGDVISFVPVVDNDDNGAVASDYELIDYTDGCFEINEIENVGKFLEVEESGYYTMIFEEEVGYDFDADELSSKIKTVKIINA